MDSGKAPARSVRDGMEPQPGEENEIDLYRLWCIVRTRKRIVFGAIVVALLIALFSLVGREPTYTYRTSVEIGKRLTTDASGDKEQRPLESASYTLAKIETTYIPLTLNTLASENDDQPLPRVRVRMPKGSEILLLESRGGADELEIHADLHRKVLDQVVADHNALLEISRRKLGDHLQQLELELARIQSPAHRAIAIGTIENKIDRARLELAALTDERLVREAEQRLENNIANRENTLKDLQNQSSLLEKKRESLKKRKALLLEEIAKIEAFIDRATAAKQEAITHTPGSTEAMATLLLDNSIHKAQERLAALKQRVEVDLGLEAEKLGNQIDANRMQQEKLIREIEIAKSQLQKERATREKNIKNQKLTIDQLQLELANAKESYQNRIEKLQTQIAQTRNDLSLILPTRAITPTVAIEKQPPSALVVLVAALLIGAFLGLILALVVDRFSKEALCDRGAAN